MLPARQGSRVSLLWCLIAALVMLLALRETQYRRPITRSTTPLLYCQPAPNSTQQFTSNATQILQSQTSLPLDEAEPENPLNVAYVTMYTETVRGKEDKEDDNYKYEEDYYFISLRML